MKNTKPKNKKKLPALDKYVIFSFVCILIFTVAVLVVFIVTGNEPAALVTCFFAAFAGELFSLARTKWLKLKIEKDAPKDKPAIADEDNDNTSAFG